MSTIWRWKLDVFNDIRQCHGTNGSARGANMRMDMKYSEMKGMPWAHACEDKR